MNVTVAGLTVASVVRPLAKFNTTFVSGRAANTTVNVSVEPDSLTIVEPPLSRIRNPKKSLSEVETLTVLFATASSESAALLPCRRSLPLPPLNASLSITAWHS